MEKEWEIYQEFFKRQVKSLNLLVYRTVLIRSKMIGSEFSRVPDTYWGRLAIYGEIVCASNFNTSNSIYVRYSIKVPNQEWYVDENVPNFLKTACTQRATPSFNKENRMQEFRFSCPFEMFLYAKTSGMVPRFLTERNRGIPKIIH